MGKASADRMLGKGVRYSLVGLAFGIVASTQSVRTAEADGTPQSPRLAPVAPHLRSRKPAAGLTHHTDRGCQYASDDYRGRLAAAMVERSMSRTGDCWDNAVAESYFATIKGECLDHERFTTRRAATAAIADYIEVFCNHQRLHSSIDYSTPVEYALKMAVAAMAA